MTIPFLKMHGLGNDFVVIDVRSTPFKPTPEQAAAIADRHRGVGCDQLVLIEPSQNQNAHAFMRIYNPDGSESGACGNATRCVAALLMTELHATQTTIETRAGLLEAHAAENGQVRVNMGQARLGWQDIPLLQEADTLHLPITEGSLTDPVGVSMGNPHCIFFVPDAEAVPLAEVGPRLEHHHLFPQRTNVEVVEVQSPTCLRLRVWERGAGITQACGSGACASVVAAARRGLTGRNAEVVMDGGVLVIEWADNGTVWMTGPAATVFHGQLENDLLTTALLQQ